MTIREAIAEADRRADNAVSAEWKIVWLGRLDGQIYREILSAHRWETPLSGYTPYTPQTPEDTVLLAGEPYDEMYVFFLEAQIYYSQTEYNKYNNAMALFNRLYAAFRSYVNRQQMPVHKADIRYF